MQNYHLNGQLSCNFSCTVIKSQSVAYASNTSSHTHSPTTMTDHLRPIYRVRHDEWIDGWMPQRVRYVRKVGFLLLCEESLFSSSSHPSIYHLTYHLKIAHQRCPEMTAKFLPCCVVQLSPGPLSCPDTLSLSQCAFCVCHTMGQYSKIRSGFGWDEKRPEETRWAAADFGRVTDCVAFNWIFMAFEE